MRNCLICLAPPRRMPAGSPIPLRPKGPLVNAFLVVIWAVTDLHGFFWPVFPIAGWGIIVVLNAWDVFWRPAVTEEDIQHEVRRQQEHEHGHG